MQAVTNIGSTDQVLDVGCGAGQSTRDAARAATLGSVLGIDVSERLLERARRLTAQEELRNVTYELGDAQTHHFAPRHFDVMISRFGTMFFTDPVAAFTNLARACRPGARLVMMVWQARGRNEWAAAIRRSLTGGDTIPSPPLNGLDPFSLADPPAVEAILSAAGFAEFNFIDVHEPVYYGPDSATAYQLVLSMKDANDILAELDATATEEALQRLRTVLSEHATSDGILFDGRSWIVTARVR